MVSSCENKRVMAAGSQTCCLCQSSDCCSAAQQITPSGCGAIKASKLRCTLDDSAHRPIPFSPLLVEWFRSVCSLQVVELQGPLFCLSWCKRKKWLLVGGKAQLHVFNVCHLIYAAFRSNITCASTACAKSAPACVLNSICVVCWSPQ